MSRWTVKKTEARTLAKRDRRTRRKGGVPLATVEATLREDMITDLRQMARAYSGKPRETRALLAAIVVAETEGITADELADVLDVLRGKLVGDAA